MNVEYYNENKGSDYQRLILMGRNFCMINTYDINDINTNSVKLLTSLGLILIDVLIVRIDD
jgi:hypothetical protein